MILVLCAAVCIGYVYEHQSALAADNSRYVTAQKLATLDSEHGAFNQAAAVWTAYASNATNRAHKNSAYLSAGAFYINSHEYLKTISMCKKSEALEGVSFDEAEMVANAYFSLGDTSDAIHYYREAIRLVPASDSERGAEIASFNHAIAILESSN